MQRPCVVRRYAGSYEHVFETTTAGVTIQAPQLDVNTVAAGGWTQARPSYASIHAVTCGRLIHCLCIHPAPEKEPLLL
jgi:hypothetical protein